MRAVSPDAPEAPAPRRTSAPTTPRCPAGYMSSACRSAALAVLRRRARARHRMAPGHPGSGVLGCGAVIGAQPRVPRRHPPQRRMGAGRWPRCRCCGSSCWSSGVGTAVGVAHVPASAVVTRFRYWRRSDGLPRLPAARHEDDLRRRASCPCTWCTSSPTPATRSASTACWPTARIPGGKSRRCRTASRSSRSRRSTRSRRSMGKGA